MKIFISLSALFLSISILNSSCKKNDSKYYLEGNINDANTGGVLSNAHVTVQKQAVSGGALGGGFTNAASGNTDGGGHFKLGWERENFAALKLVAEYANYIKRETTLPLGSFAPGETITQSLSLYPESFVSVHLRNITETHPNDIIKFTFVNALFDCSCCDNGWKTFEGAAVDTTFQCRLYGDFKLRYQQHIITANLDTTITDSIWCPSFQTSAIEITY